MITCKSALALMEPSLDGELDASHKADIEGHLEECPNCFAIFRRLNQLRGDLRARGLRYEAPEQLRSRVLSGLRQEARTVAPDGRRAFPRRLFRSWAIAATLLLTVSLAWNLMELRSQRNAGSEVAEQIVASHVRSLIGDHLLDIPSTDRHNVKPWFNGRLDYAPDVRDLAAEGFPLIGGRVDYIDRKSVAALVYKRQQHVINLFVWPSDTRLAAPENVTGFNLVVWNKSGLSYCAVSDLNRAELRQFADLYRR